MRGRAIRPVLLALLLAPAAVAFGYIGYRQVPGQDFSTTDVLFKVMQLFAVEAIVPPEGTPWQLDVARFLAPLAVVYAAVITAISLLRDQATRAWISVTARGHVVVVGLGATGSVVASSLRRRGWRVVALEADPTNPRVRGARADGVSVIFGDGSNRRLLNRTKPHRARHVIVMTGDDSRNLHVSATARAALADTPRAHTTVHVAIANAGLWQELSRMHVQLSRAHLSTEYVNLADRTALRLLDQFPTGSETDSAELLVDGDTDVAVRLVVHVIRRAAAAGVLPRVHVTSPCDGDLLARIRLQEPWCESAADLVAYPPGTLPDAESKILQAFVCPAEDDAAAVTRALTITRRLPHALVVAAVYRDASEHILSSAGVVEDRLQLISAKLDALGTELIDRSAIELMARARHEQYVLGEQARGVTATENPSLVSWDDLPESLRESNRSFARAAGLVLGAMGAVLEPARGAARAEINLPEPVIEQLAEREHERWMSSLVETGWKATTGPKDPARKLHPLLVPWEELTEAERAKDRDSVHALPRMLARTGYTIVLPEEALP